MPKGGARKGAGRPPVDEKVKQDCFYIRLHPEDKTLIKSYCTDHHVSISKLARDCIFAHIRADMESGKD